MRNLRQRTKSLAKNGSDAAANTGGHRGCHTGTCTKRRDGDGKNCKAGTNTGACDDGEKCTDVGRSTNKGACDDGKKCADTTTTSSTTTTDEQEPTAVSKWKAFARLLTIHRRYGHCGLPKLRWLLQTNPSIGKFTESELEMFSLRLKTLCKDCAAGSHVSAGVPKKTKSDPVTSRSQRMSCDVLGKWPNSRAGNSYVWVFVNSYSDYVSATPVKHKSQYLAALKEALIEQGLMKGHRIILEQLRSDAGSEPTSAESRAWYIANGIEFKCAAPGVLAMNGKCESTIRRVLENMRIEFSRVERSLKTKSLRRHWDYLIQHVVDVRNDVTNERISPETPRQLQLGQDAGSATRVPELWFAPVMTKERRPDRHKFDPNGRFGFFLMRSKYMPAAVVLTESGSIINSHAPVFTTDQDTWIVDLNSVLAREPDKDGESTSGWLDATSMAARGDEDAEEDADTADPNENEGHDHDRDLNHEDDHANSDDGGGDCNGEDKSSSEDDSDDRPGLPRGQVRRLRQRLKKLKKQSRKETPAMLRIKSTLSARRRAAAPTSETINEATATAIVDTPPAPPVQMQALTPLQQRAVEAQSPPQFSSFSKVVNSNETIHVKLDIDNEEDVSTLKNEAEFLGLGSACSGI